jgi:hypothetical protein
MKQWKCWESVGLGDTLCIGVLNEFLPKSIVTFLVQKEQIMSDDLKNRGGQDRSRINVHEEHEVRYWTQELGVTREQLEAAVKAAGVMASDVRKHLGK